MAESFESFCERCGTRQVAEPPPPPALASRLLRGLRRSERSDLDPAASTTQRTDAFLRLCLACRGYNCPNCWNNAAGFCLDCVPPNPLAEEVTVREHVPAEALQWPAGDLLGRQDGVEAAAADVHSQTVAPAESVAPAETVDEIAQPLPEPAAFADSEQEVELAAEPTPAEAAPTGFEAAAFADSEQEVELAPSSKRTGDLIDSVDIAAILELPAVYDLLAELPAPGQTAPAEDTTHAGLAVTSTTSDIEIALEPTAEAEPEVEVEAVAEPEVEVEAVAEPEVVAAAENAAEPAAGAVAETVLGPAHLVWDTEPAAEGPSTVPVAHEAGEQAAQQPAAEPVEEEHFVVQPGLAWEPSPTAEPGSTEVATLETDADTTAAPLANVDFEAEPEVVEADFQGDTEEEVRERAQAEAVAERERAQAEAVAEREPQPEAVAEREPQPEAVAEAEPQPEAVAEPEPQPEAVAEPEPQPEREVRPAAPPMPWPMPRPVQPLPPSSPGQAPFPPATAQHNVPGGPSAALSTQLPMGALPPSPSAASGLTGLVPPGVELETTPQTRDCHNCQLPVSAKARFCRRCGSPQRVEPH
ncbi:MAG TPA: hypothetical protein VMP67_05000 [Candidatus Limnocylindria bacterium]|nr:hypothetical protein [Candidatus Limnocylindria bacterium]